MLRIAAACGACFVLGAVLGGCRAEVPADAVRSARQAWEAMPGGKPLAFIGFEDRGRPIPNLAVVHERSHSGHASGKMSASGDADYVLAEVGPRIDFSGVAAFTLTVWTHLEALEHGGAAIRVVYRDADDAVVGEARLGTLTQPERAWTRHVFASREPAPESAAYGRVQLGLRSLGEEAKVAGVVFFDDITLAAAQSEAVSPRSK